MTGHPRLDQVDVLEAGQLADGGVDAAGGGTSLGVAEEVARQEARLGRRRDAAADRCPEALDDEARDARRAAGATSRRSACLK